MSFSVQLRLFSAAVECGGLPDPLNGYVVLTDVILGSVATYNCQTGFSLVGSATRECARSGRWTGVPPTCESKNISAPHPSITCSNFYILLLAKLIGEESQNSSELGTLAPSQFYLSVCTWHTMTSFGVEAC